MPFIYERVVILAVLTKQKINANGVAPSFTAASATGDEMPNDGNTVCHVKNGSASSITVTINSQEKCSQGFDHDLTITVPASGERMIGPFSRTRFNNTNGNVEVSYSAVTSVTVAALSI